MATDSAGNTNTSLPVTLEVRTTSTNNHLPVATITSPVPPTSNITGFLVTNALTVREGQLAVTGNAYDPDGGDGVSYQFLLLDPNSPSGAPLYNVTPGPLNSQRFHLGAVTNASLGTLDLSVVQNGAYLLKLVVRGGGDVASASLPIAVSNRRRQTRFTRRREA